MSTRDSFDFVRVFDSNGRVSMGFHKVLKWSFILALTMFAAQLLADAFDNEFEEKPWAEIEVQLPAFPEKENLIPFKVGAITGARYLIDGNSLSVGSDSVIRYVMIVLSAEGAQNISYEGMRCATGERRFYAFGRADKTWSKARNNQWVKVQGSTNNHHVELYTNYFCPVGAAVILSAEDARHSLRSGGKPAVVGR